MGRTSNQADRRLRDIEVLLLWEGRVGNARLRDLYDIGLGAASVLIKAYRVIFPQACAWNTVERLYTAVPGLVKPKLSSGATSDYLELLGRSGFQDGPITYDGRVDLTNVAPDIFSTLHLASSRKQGVELVYASMSTPVAQARTFFPQRLVQAGRRWHVRGFDGRTMSHVDFTLGRVISATVLPQLFSQETPPDIAWETEVTFTIFPHPLLTAAQAAVIEREYMGSQASRQISCRAAMVPYVIQDLRISVKPSDSPPDFQLAAERDAIEQFLFR